MGLDVQELAIRAGCGRGGPGSMGPGHRLGLVVGEGPGVTVRTTDDGVRVDPGTDDAKVVVALGDDAWRRSPGGASSRSSACSTPACLQVERGEFEQFAAWEPAMQALLYDRPVYDAAAAAPSRGGPRPFLRPRRRPGRDGGVPRPPRAISTCGGVFGADELEVLSAEIERLRTVARPTTCGPGGRPAADGRDVCCRVTFMSERSAVIAALVDDAATAHPRRV